MTCKISVHWIFRKSHNSVGRRPYFLQGLGICWWILKWGQNNQFEEESYELWEGKQGKKTLLNNISRRWWANINYDQKYSFLFFLFFFPSFFYFSSTQTLDCDGWEGLALLRRMALSYRLCTYMLLKMGTLSSNLEDDICASILSNMNI